jgi:enterochelin esterase-like enzyme
LPNLDPNREYPLFLATDAQWDRQWMANGLENCARDGIIPPTVGVFIEPGQDKPGNYSDRSHEYDELTDDYSNFIFTEILPQVEKIVKLSHDPAQRATSGVSSGGIAGFTICWRHPESFSTVISAVGSFDNIASGASGHDGGHNYPFIIRMADKKPIRVFLQDGSHDLDNKFGSW